MNYINEMEKYLYNHNYISENNNNKKQQELSKERASCIVQKYRTLTEEKDNRIDKAIEYIENINYINEEDLEIQKEKVISILRGEE